MVQAEDGGIVVGSYASLLGVNPGYTGLEAEANGEVVGADIRAGLSGMSGALWMSTDKLPDNLSESLLFGGAVLDRQIKGGFYTFGRCDNPALISATCSGFLIPFTSYV